jgi:hypothetical protein
VRGSPRSPRERRQGVGVFGCVSWGWAVTLALLGAVLVTVAVGWWINDPGRNPAPAAYPGAACGAFDQLEEATDELRVGVAGGRDGDRAGADRAAAAAERAAVAASDISSRLPAWGPGEPLNQLLASLIVATLNGADALAERDLAAAEEELAVAEELVASGRRAFDERRFGFACG